MGHRFGCGFATAGTITFVIVLAKAPRPGERRSLRRAGGGSDLATRGRGDPKVTFTIRYFYSDINRLIRKLIVLIS